MPRDKQPGYGVVKARYFYTASEGVGDRETIQVTTWPTSNLHQMRLCWLIVHYSDAEAMIRPL